MRKALQQLQTCIWMNETWGILDQNQNSPLIMRQGCLELFFAFVHQCTTSPVLRGFGQESRATLGGLAVGEWGMWSV